MMYYLPDWQMVMASEWAESYEKKYKRRCADPQDLLNFANSRGGSVTLVQAQHVLCNEETFTEVVYRVKLDEQEQNAVQEAQKKIKDFDQQNALKALIKDFDQQNALSFDQQKALKALIKDFDQQNALSQNAVSSKEEKP